MKETLEKIIDLLEPQDRRRVLLLLALILVTGIIETAGVASIVPFVAVLSDPGVLETNAYLSAAYSWLGFQTTQSFLFFLGLLVLAAVIVGTALSMLTNWAVLHFTSMRSHTLSRRLFAGYLNRPYAWFFGRHGADLGKTVLSEVGQVIGGVLVPTLQLITHGLSVLFLVSLLVVVDPLLAFVIITVLGGAYWLIYWISRRHLYRKGEERVRTNRERFQLSSEALGGIKDVKVLGLEDAFLRRFEKASRRFFQTQISAAVITQFPPYALRAIAFTGVMLILQYLLLVQGDFSQALPLIVLYVLAGSRLLPAFQIIYQCVSRLRFSKPALDNLHRDLVEQKVVQQSLNQSNVTEVNGLDVRNKVELRHINYCYPGASTPALDDISLTFPAQASVGIMGKTGAGKTTLADVMLGLLDMQRGQLLVDGKPIAAANKRNWQRAIGYVPQHIFLADDSIAANIAFGVSPSEINMVAVVRAARIANLHDFVTGELEHGYDTLIGERGVRLSGGQRQRVGIARALYRDPALLIMDEATNSLDYMTERAVMDAIANLAGQKTLIVITHRLTTVRHCDIIFLLERGKVVSSGSYDELIDRSTHFREMVNGSSRSEVGGSRPAMLVTHSRQDRLG